MKKIDGEGDNPPYGCKWHLQECVINCDCENLFILIVDGKKKLTNQLNHACIISTFVAKYVNELHEHSHRGSHCIFKTSKEIKK